MRRAQQPPGAAAAGAAGAGSAEWREGEFCQREREGGGERERELNPPFLAFPHVASSYEVRRERERERKERVAAAVVATAAAAACTHTHGHTYTRASIRTNTIDFFFFWGGGGRFLKWRDDKMGHDFRLGFLPHLHFFCTPKPPLRCSTK